MVSEEKIFKKLTRQTLAIVFCFNFIIYFTFSDISLKFLVIFMKMVKKIIYFPGKANGPCLNRKLLLTV